MGIHVRHRPKVSVVRCAYFGESHKNSHNPGLPLRLPSDRGKAVAHLLNYNKHLI